MSDQHFQSAATLERAVREKLPGITFNSRARKSFMGRLRNYLADEYTRLGEWLNMHLVRRLGYQPPHTTTFFYRQSSGAIPEEGKWQHDRFDAREEPVAKKKHVLLCHEKNSSKTIRIISMHRRTVESFEGMVSQGNLSRLFHSGHVKKKLMLSIPSL